MAADANNRGSTAAATALIAEDEPLLAQALQAALRREWPELQVLANVGDGVQALSKTLALRPALCFLDIRMPGLTGLEVAQALAEDWPAQEAPFPLLVFITAHDHYALQAFEHAAVDYLLKPVEPARLARCVQRLRQTLAARQAAPAAQAPALDDTLAQLRGLLAQSGGPAASAPPPPRLQVIQAGAGSAVHFVPVEDVLYFEAADKYVRVITAEAEHLIRMPLKELLPQLDPDRFWQIHRGTIVQARCIRTAVRDESGKVHLTLRGRPEKLTASRLYAHLFRAF
ncbi:LytR/AlgR family response regulator transcription factor [Azohydromonas australica]|uniref:LytR/AlgR family response regulator transcription factor n=1 Tax=Azohydromonas australica TaxID=364039 RepID=UPI0004208DAF|nr:LytTR family DNA-binding domain-containing protein [Azohydromonas australica]